ncbi:polysaccharide deacetylase [Clostridium niameyense]|uniref:Polysaccharide deacetylase n=1 Tax=Clostridium niameyense TaxID=1622073 RepID=A0A6M0R6M0_9CLOT|nr:polysaccharide deacetylase family protein [Clostridium niameyense]NEZ45824.1 polysaccharide deacetylase [Clostridium niameyense]
MIKLNNRFKWDLRKITTMLLFTFALLSIVVTEGKVIAMKIEKSSLNKKLTTIQQDNNNMESKNAKLLSDIKGQEDVYKEKLKNVKIAYLTFDDGPSNNTKDILKILKENNIKATFFVNGHPKLANLYKEIQQDGHVIANHTYSHDYSNVYISPENFEKDVKKLDKFLEDTTGKNSSHIIRYPGGSNNTISHRYGGRSVMKSILPYMEKKGYVYFDWNVDSTDASAFCQKKERIVNSVLSQSRGTHQAVILMHDTNPKVTTVQALPEIIKGLKEQGFIFEVLTKDSPRASLTR